MKSRAENGMRSAIIRPFCAACLASPARCWTSRSPAWKGSMAARLLEV